MQAKPYTMAALSVLEDSAGGGTLHPLQKGINGHLHLSMPNMEIMLYSSSVALWLTLYFSVPPLIV